MLPKIVNFALTHFSHCILNRTIDPNHPFIRPLVFRLGEKDKLNMLPNVPGLITLEYLTEVSTRSLIKVCFKVFSFNKLKMICM